MSKKRYRLYIDESGDHTFEKVDNSRHRYLTLLGVWFESGPAYDDFAMRLRQFKDSIFGPRHDDPICLHRRDIIGRKGPFGCLKDPEISARFDEGLLDLVSTADFRICAVTLDKKEHETKKYRLLYHPYHYCLTVLLERYAGWLEIVGAEGDVMAESRGRREDEELKKVFRRTHEDGTRFHAASRFQAHLTSHKIKLKKKEHLVPGLELSDLLAAPAKYEMVEGAPPPGFGGRLLKAVEPKLNCHMWNGKVWGYGKVLLK